MKLIVPVLTGSINSFVFGKMVETAFFDKPLSPLVIPAILIVIMLNVADINFRQK
jgi:putative effector of murein hydrolase